MKPRKLIKTAFNILFGVLLLAGAVCWFIASNVRTALLATPRHSSAMYRDTLIIHFIHGGVPKKHCPKQTKRLGGFFGGHIEIESSGRVYGFVYDTLPVHIFSCKKYNARFEKNEVSVWEEKTKAERKTSVYLPVSAIQKQRTDSLLENYVKRTPYDYAFFGQRCASSTMGILCEAGIFKKFSSAELVIAFFYPKPVRLTLMRFAKKHHLKTAFHKGSDCVRWE